MALLPLSGQAIRGDLFFVEAIFLERRRTQKGRFFFGCLETERLKMILIWVFGRQIQAAERAWACAGGLSDLSAT